MGSAALLVSVTDSDGHRYDLNPISAARCEAQLGKYGHAQTRPFMGFDYVDSAEVAPSGDQFQKTSISGMSAECTRAWLGLHEGDTCACVYLARGMRDRAPGMDSWRPGFRAPTEFSQPSCSGTGKDN